MLPEQSSFKIDDIPTAPIGAMQQGRSLSEERREASRFRRESGTDYAVIWKESGEKMLVEVHDESLSGLGIWVESTLGLEVGSTLQVIYAGECMDGEVRQILQEGDRYRVGIRCDRMLNDGVGY